MATDLLPPETDREPTAPPSPVEGRTLYRLSVAQYGAMAQAGILTNRDRVELIDGLLVSRMTKNPLHQLVISNACYALIRLLPNGWLVRTESPLILPESVPEPDLMVLRGRNEDFATRHPSPENVALVIEVSDSSYAEDVKLIPIYAEARIPYYWIVNIPGGRIEVYSDPTGPDMAPTYRVRREFGRADSVTIDLPDRAPIGLPVVEVLPEIRP